MEQQKPLISSYHISFCPLASLIITHYSDLAFLSLSMCLWDTTDCTVFCGQSAADYPATCNGYQILGEERWSMSGSCTSIYNKYFL